MTEMEIEAARDDLTQLSVEQLRCGVMLQLLKIESLTAERDALAAASQRFCDLIGCEGSPLLQRIAAASTKVASLQDDGK